MSKYDKTKFYWLQLKEDFFDTDAIQWLEEQPNGKEYSLFYLKLCLKSLKTNGILIRNVGNLLVPYDARKLSEITRTDYDTVVVAMKLLEHIGLIKILENGEIYIEQLESMIGSQSIGAFKKQQQRQLGGTNVRQVSSKCPIEKEIELEKELEIDIKTTDIDIYSYIEGNFGITISGTNYELISQWLKTYDIEILKYAVDICVKNGSRTIGYFDGILKNWVGRGYKSLQDIKDKDIKKKPPTPAWFDKDIQKEPLDESKQKELDELIKKYK